MEYTMPMIRRSKNFFGMLLVSLLCNILFSIPASASSKPNLSAENFYTPPQPLPHGEPGQVIKTQDLTNSAALPSAARNILVLYHSRSITGKDIAVSGSIAIPHGKPPSGGWPVTTWAHGTTGISALCAPSKDTPQAPEHFFLSMKQKLMDSYVKRGFVVVATDYEKLGPPGVHPFLQGESEGRGILDIVRAARSIEPEISNRYVIIGHSQGGHADLFAAAIAPQYAPELKLLGNVAMAPASHIAVTIQQMVEADKPSYQLGYVIYVLESFASNHAIDLNKILSPVALKNLPATKHTCISALVSSGYWAKAIPKQQFLPNANFNDIKKIALYNEPSRLRINVPTLIVQGTADDTVLPKWTDAVVTKLCKNGVNLRYSVYKNATHETIPARSSAEVYLWVVDRFLGKKALSNCLDQIKR
jgi:pimeloyl-ACP methyl ester carboxylesterase